MLTEVCGVDPAFMELSFNQETQVRGWFIDAGLRAEINPLETSATLPPGSSNAYLSARPWGQRFFRLAADERHAALTRIDERLASYELANGDVTVPFRAFLVIAESG